MPQKSFLEIFRNRKLLKRKNVTYRKPFFLAGVNITLILTFFLGKMYSSTCHERTPSGPGKSVRSLQVAADQR